MEEKSASTAVMKIDGKEFMGRTLSVAISAPPKTDKPGNSDRSNAGTSFARKPFAAKTEQKPRISFIPASVQKAATTKDSNVQSPAQPLMSNDDFRKMLLK